MSLNYLMTKVSPHVEIYKFPITAISSITNRVSGLYLTGIFIGCGISGLTNYNIINSYNKLDKNKRIMFEYSLYLSSSYHILGGLRHFIWDRNPALLNNTSVVRSSYLLFSSSIVSSFMIDKIINKRVK
mgnify:CR=1 FL=1